MYQYNELVSFELLKDGYTITKGGLGRAAVGAFLFDGVGAIVGGVTGGKKTKGVVESLRIKVVLNNGANPTEYLEFVSFPMKESNPLYKAACHKAQECLSMLQLICSTNENENAKSNTTIVMEASSADEIMKFKRLLDEGIITKEEFDVKKKALLGI